MSVFLLYLLLLFAVASVSRGGLGLEHALVSHYKVISVSIVMLVAVGLLDYRYCGPGKPCPQAAVLLGGTLFRLLSWWLCYRDTGFFDDPGGGAEKIRTAAA